MSRYKRNVVKEAFDNLPGAVCFFDEKGMVVLCNHQMHRLVFALNGRDLQGLSELKGILQQKDFVLEDGTVWHFSRENVQTREGETYIQVTGTDITELYHRKKELEHDNQRLKEYAERMKQLSANIISLIREEEILNMKMRVHDDIGRSVISTRQFLQQNRPMEELDLTVWKQAVRLLKHENELTEEKDALKRLTHAADGIGIKILLDGEVPENTEYGSLLILIIQECMTNAVRHAGATELYVKVVEDGSSFFVSVTNNGEVPEGEITLGGGLTSLQTHVHKKGGRMTVRSKPVFALEVSIPVRREEES